MAPLAPLLGAGIGSPTGTEFQPVSTPSDTSFALLAFNGTSRIRGIRFPTEIYSRLVTCIKHTWPEGMEWATLQSDDGWDCLLKGTPWKKKGNEEVESIRLIIGLLQTLSKEGWNLAQEVNVGAARKDVHNFVFRHDGFPVPSDKFFAITFPLPDRISLVDPPPTCTPAIISSIRSAILTPDQSPDVLQSPKAIRTDHSSPKLGFGRIFNGGSSDAAGGSTPNSSTPEQLSPISPHRGKSCAGGDVSGTNKKLKIKEEGWAGTGVYGFELRGYSIFAGRGTSDFKYDSHHPSLLLALITNLTQHQAHLVTSVRLTPIKLRRDVLIFTHPTPDHGFDTLDDLILPPRLSFPTGGTASPTSPNFPSNATKPRPKSRRFSRVRPSSLASLNGGPLLPSIPASPSWEEEDGRSPAAIHQLVTEGSGSSASYFGKQNDQTTLLASRSKIQASMRVPLTAGPRLESTPAYAAPENRPVARQRKHRKSSSMPGKVANGWTTTPAPTQPQINSLETSETLRDSFDRPKEHPDHISPRHEALPGLPSAPSRPVFVSNNDIKLKEVRAAHEAPRVGYAPSSAAVRGSEVPEHGTLSFEPFPDSGSGSDSGNRTATSSFEKQRQPDPLSKGGLKATSKRRGLRSFVKALL